MDDKFLFFNDLYKKSSGSFYILDTKRLVSNYETLFNAFSKNYPLSTIAYSYKTNYTPYLCRQLHDIGAWAEVVSDMEYIMAEKLIAHDKIIVNGPFHNKNFVEICLMNQSILNLDDWYLLDMVEEVCLANPTNNFQIGLRFTFDLQGIQASRFGFSTDINTLSNLRERINRIPNLNLHGLHCHFSTSSRSLKSYEERTRNLINLYKTHFAEHPIKYINIGGGFFSNMSDELKYQFDYTIPGLDEYGQIIEKVVFEELKETGIQFIIEPGTALVADTISFISKIVGIKNLGNRKLVLVDGSVQNIKPTMNTKNLPFNIYTAKKEIQPFDFDIVGYTCMENDFLCQSVSGSCSVGDIIEFENCGGYTTVFKPPFIRPQFPVFAIENDNIIEIKRSETVDNILETYKAGL